MTSRRESRLRLAIATPTISHFEAPLYRLLAAREDIELTVAHADTLQRSRFDLEHQTVIDWGRDVAEGFAHVQCATTRDVAGAVWASRPDVILLYGYSWPGALRLLLEAKIRRVPVIFRGTISHQLDPRRGRSGAIARALRPAILRLFDACHYGGDFSKHVLSAAGIPEAKLYFVPYSVESGYFLKEAALPTNAARARALRESWGWRSSDFVVLFLSQHNWVKGVDLAVPTVAELQRRCPHAKLVMAGSGSLTQEIHEAAAQQLRPGSFAFTGFIPSYDTVPYYLASDVAFYPSRYETWARGVNEAMLCDRPCLVTDRVAASGGLVEDGLNGAVVKDATPHTMAKRLAELAEMAPLERDQMGEAARARALRFSYEDCAQAAVDSVLERRR